ncbi:Hypothetical Protein FCC1311_095272 [Hondaea fermentalgiana]|uniref:BZIP domain-containing protein n=1 Tax=Hondaea fermentalgiana TaxID=2315210 RepID=A0A2R5GX88_9STRA|nr:Hypothetical Protein FCC1311_095272 [Hondaea fermentalgiana]|eukprot:GBG33303.1 Hypothetical Protein FCC1311_095272 [Hondaea fermentalgiana]
MADLAEMGMMALHGGQAALSGYLAAAYAQKGGAAREKDAMAAIFMEDPHSSGSGSDARSKISGSSEAGSPGAGRGGDFGEDNDDDDDDDDNSGSGGDDGGNEVGAPRAAGKNASRKQRNAEACRRSRRKRKAAVDNLRKRNEELEEARDVYLERIAELQLQLGALKHAGVNDIARENELLRAEIRKHKASIAKIIRATTEAPNVLPEERLRLLETSIDDNLSQIIGLAHTSATWTPLNTLHSATGITAFPRHQLLPEHAPLEEVKRWTCRVDFCDVPSSAHLISESLWQSECDPESKKAIHERDWDDGFKRKVESYRVFEGQPELEKTVGDRLSMSRYSEVKVGEDGNETLMHSMVCSATRACKVLVPRALLPKDDNEDNAVLRATYDCLPEGTERCHVVSSAEITKSLHQVQLIPSSETRDVPPSTGMFWGWLVTPLEENPPRCHMTLIFSSALGHMSHLMDAQSLMHPDEENGLSPNFERFLEYQCLVVEKHIANSQIIKAEQKAAAKMGARSSEAST